MCELQEYSMRLQTNACSCCIGEAAIQCQERTVLFQQFYSTTVSGLVVSGTPLVLEELPESLPERLMA